ncbi:MAG: metal ABC transporter ATP-binding protein [Fibrobacterota bacterium]
MKGIRVEHLYLSYGQEYVVEDLSFSINPGDFLALVGPNGGGKTSLIKALMGILQPVSGHILRSREFSRNIGYMPQSRTGHTGGFPATVYEVVASALWAQKGIFQKLSAEDKKQIEHALGLLDIEKLRLRRIDELSGGQRQRVFLARAFALDPALLILDEPTGALDQQTRECFYKTLRELNQHDNKTLIMVTHDTEYIDAYAQKILSLDKKQLYFGDVTGFYAREKKHYFNHLREEIPCSHGEDA